MPLSNRSFIHINWCRVLVSQLSFQVGYHENSTRKLYSATSNKPENFAIVKQGELKIG